MNFINARIEKYGGAKCFTILSLCLLTIIFISSLFINSHQKSFKANGFVFKYDKLANDIWYFTDENNMVLKAYNSTGGKLLSAISNDSIIIEYDGHTIRNENSYDDFLSKLYVDDKLIYEKPLLSISVGYSNSREEVSDFSEDIFELQLLHGAMNVSDYISNGGFFHLFLLSCFLCVLGTSQLIFPNAYWHLKYFLVVDGGDPSEFFVFMTQLAGLICIGASLLLPVFIL